MRRTALTVAFAAIPVGVVAELAGSVPSPLLDLASGWAMAAGESQTMMLSNPGG
jgi:hypothetical protein